MHILCVHVSCVSMWRGSVRWLDGELTGTQHVRQAFALLRIQHLVSLLQGSQHFLFETLGSLDARAQRFGRGNPAKSSRSTESAVPAMLRCSSSRASAS